MLIITSLDLTLATISSLHKKRVTLSNQIKTKILIRINRDKPMSQKNLN